MKRLSLAICGLAMLAAPISARAYHSWSIGVSFTGPQVVSVAEFNEPLADYGHWVDTPEYGRVWQPGGVDPDWRPYSTDGHWVWTDSGWYWESERPWGWACFHYGNWVFTPRVGWCWVPGIVWSPAWVVWRESDDYVGWAPCPPARFHAYFAAGEYCDPGIRFADFVVVERGHFCDRIAPGVVIASRQNITIIHNTVNITRVRTVNNIVVNGGPKVARIESATHQTIQRRTLRDMSNSWQRPEPKHVEQTRAVQTDRGAGTTAVDVRRAPENAPKNNAPRNTETYRNSADQNRTAQSERYSKGQPAVNRAASENAAPVANRGVRETPAPVANRPTQQAPSPAPVAATQQPAASKAQRATGTQTWDRDASGWAHSVDATRSKRYAPTAEQQQTGPNVPARLQAPDRSSSYSPSSGSNRQDQKQSDKSGKGKDRSGNGYGN